LKKVVRLRTRHFDVYLNLIFNICISFHNL